MNLKTRLERLEKAEPERLKPVEEMTDAELLAEIRKYRNYPEGYEPTDDELIEIIREEGKQRRETARQKEAPE